MAGAARARQEGCDVLVAVGGGSVIDAAKGVGIVLASGGHILDYEGVDQVPLPMPPLICVPTTGGTSADVSQFACREDTICGFQVGIGSSLPPAPSCCLAQFSAERNGGPLRLSARKD